MFRHRSRMNKCIILIFMVLFTLGNSQRRCENMACPDVYEPVCASNGRTYGNLCELNTARCRNPRVRFRHEGECRRPQGCERLCPLLYDPVCGTNGRTYSNRCVFRNAACRNPYLRIAYRGRCRRPRDCERPSCPFNIYEPVCGTNGRTYANRCLFGNAACRNPYLRIAYRGECRQNRWSRT